VAVLTRFWRDYCARHLRSYLLGFLFLLATTLLTVAIPVFVEHAVDAMEGDAAGEAVHWAWAVIAAGIGIMGVRTLSRIFFFNPGREVEFDIKNDLFRHLTDMPRRFFDRMRPGEIISRGTNDASSVRAFIGFGLLQLFNVAFTLFFTVGQMLLTEALLTALCLIPLVGAALVLRYAIRKMLSLVRRSQEQVATLSERVLECYNGATVLQGFGAMGGAAARFDADNQELLDISMGLVWIQSWLLPVVNVVGNACLIVVLYAGGAMVIDGDLSKGELAAFAVYIRIVAGALFSMGWLVNALQRGWISLGRINEVLHAPTLRPDAARPLPPPTGPGGRALTVRGLDFQHPTRREGDVAAEAALKDVTFEVAPGETLGIFGLTGSGKSTLLDVIARIYEPPPRTIFLDGVDVRELPLREWWRALAYVPQDAFLFSTTLRDNIALAAPPGERDEPRVEVAAAAAALTDDLEALPDGLDTVVGERGITLSGGQRQRTALARAFYRDFELLLLDDVLSAVDHATEKRLIDAIYARASGATTLVVSHRISVLKRAHRIVVLDGGRCVASGTHEELLAQGVGPYVRTHRLQEARERAAVPGPADAIASREGGHVPTDPT